jgi:valyl-tRNA synthetase
MLAKEIVHHRPINTTKELADLIKKLAGVSEIETTTEQQAGAMTFLVGTTEYAVPLEGLVDVEAEREKAMAEIKRLEGFLLGIEKKLGNERFVSSAPAAVVELERKKKADAETKIAALRQQWGI